MRIHVLSDLHIEVEPFTPPEVEADLVVLAGDVHNGAAAIEWARIAFDKPVLFVPGNHEAYDHELAASTRAIHAAARGTHVTVLDCGEVVRDGVRFLGCTLWTGFELPTPRPRDEALALCRAFITDFRAIRLGEERFSLEDSVMLYRAQKKWLEAKLAEPYGGPTVVVTHHAPHPGSIAPKFATHPANPGFVNDLDALMGPARLWIHGHTHTAFDYAVHGTRIVCNPRGYPGEPTGFDPGLVIEI